MLVFGVPARAVSLNPTKLFCSIRDGKFLTQLEFRMALAGSEHPELQGELSNFLIQNDGSKKYISGLLFAHMGYNDMKIVGDTGDPSSINGHFSLSRLDAGYQGRWAYWFQRSETEVVRAVFNCAYQNIAPRDWAKKPKHPNTVYTY
ncbi:MAG: hypothetical protein JST80_06735 [Bdellovibrionales bacterium]|nr:hypothetical protein [Bdellovibrionales bacterium]